MNRSFIKYTKRTWLSILFWMMALGFFTIFRYYGMTEEATSSLNGSSKFRTYLTTSEGIVIFLFIGLFIGLVNAIIEFLYEEYMFKLPLGVNFILSSSLYLSSVILILSIVMYFLNSFYNMNLNAEYDWWIYNKTFRSLVLYMLFASVMFSFIKIATDKFGKGVFFKMLTGKYKEPKEEKRVFLFIDLKSSTQIAEELGHLKYSQLIQDCFYHLNEVVPKYDGEIYQYVGDEAVISWPYKKGVFENNCLELFFAFEQKLYEKGEYYTNKYKVTPEFKAGFHGGILMVAEVGVVKKEIAYHGDVINTASRIQAECTTHNVSVLISSQLLEELSIDKKYIYKFRRDILLRGKSEKVKLFSIDKPHD